MDETQSRAQERLEELGAGLTQTKRGNIYTLTIIGQIEGHQAQPETIKTTKYEHVLPLLATIEESEDIDGLLLLLNTVGGDIEAGLAIAELIAGMRKPSVSLVLRRALRRHPVGRFGPEEHDRPDGQHDDPPCAHERRRGRRTGDLSLFSAHSGADHGLCHGEFPHHARAVLELYDGDRADRHGRRYDRLWA